MAEIPYVAGMQQTKQGNPRPFTAGMHEAFTSGRGLARDVSQVAKKGVTEAESLSRAEFERFTEESNMKSMINGALQAKAIKDPTRRNEFLQRRIRNGQAEGRDMQDTINLMNMPYKEQDQSIEGLLQIGGAMKYINVPKPAERKSYEDVNKRRRYADTGELMFGDVKKEVETKPYKASSPVGKLMQDRNALVKSGAPRSQIAAIDANIAKINAGKEPTESDTARWMRERDALSPYSPTFEQDKKAYNKLIAGSGKGKVKGRTRTQFAKDRQSVQDMDFAMDKIDEIRELQKTGSTSGFTGGWNRFWADFGTAFSGKKFDIQEHDQLIDSFVAEVAPMLGNNPRLTGIVKEAAVLALSKPSFTTGEELSAQVLDKMKEKILEERELLNKEIMRDPLSGEVREQEGTMEPSGVQRKPGVFQSRLEAYKAKYGTE